MFMNYLELVSRKVEERVANEIPDKFALVIPEKLHCTENATIIKYEEFETGSLTSEHLEEQLSLKVNKWFWSPQTVESACNQ